MANKTAQQLLTESRQRADMENTNFVSDDEVMDRVNSAAQELQDLIVDASQAYYITQFPFSLTSSSTANALDVTTIPSSIDPNTGSNYPPFYKVYGLDYFIAGQAYPQTVNQFNFAERNRLNGLSLGIAGGQRQFNLVGDRLTIMPWQNAGGQYNLWYVPTAIPLSVPVVITYHAPTLMIIGVTPSDDNVVASGTVGLFSFENGFFGHAAPKTEIAGELVITGAANAANNGTFRIIDTYPDFASTQLQCSGSFVTETFGGGVTAQYAYAPVDGAQNVIWTMNNGAFDQSYVGAKMTVSGTAFNNGTFTIATVQSSTTFTVSESHVQEIFPSTFVASIQLPGTRPTLDNTMQIYNEYITIRTAINLKQKQEDAESVAVLEKELELVIKRIQALTPARTSEPEQCPIVDSPYRNGGFWGDGC